MIRRNSLFCLVVLSILFMSVGYSSFNNNLYIDDMGMVVRTIADIRVTNITLFDTNNATSTYEEYDVNSIIMGVNLNSSDASITYVVDVTNYGNVDMGIFNISGIDDASNVTYEISNYKVKDKICNEENVCNNGITKSFYVTIKHKDTSTASGNYNLKLTFDFRKFHTVTYEEVIENESFPLPKEVLEGDNLVVDFNPYLIADVFIFFGDLIYNDYTFEKQILTVRNVLEDVRINAINYEKEVMADNQAAMNLEDSISLIQTAEGALSECMDILQRMNELTVRALNDTNTPEDLSMINREMEQLVNELNWIFRETLFNDIDILNENRKIEIALPYDNFIIELKKMSSSVLNVDYVEFTSSDVALTYMDNLNDAIIALSLYRSYLGGKQNASDSLINFFNVSSEELNCLYSLEVTKNKLAIVGLSGIRDYLGRIIDLCTQLENAVYEEYEKAFYTTEIYISIDAIDTIVNNNQLRGVSLLKGEYSYVPDVSSIHLGEDGGELYLDFSSTENIIQTRNGVTSARDRINALIERLSNEVL